MEQVGVQSPRVWSVPPFTSSVGVEAVELARSAGLVLDPWQAFVVENALGRRDDGRWSAFEVAVNVPRQNGKGAILEARELAGLFLLGERMIIHSAHQFDTSLEAFRRLLELVEDTPELARQVKRVSRSHGEEGIELMSRQRIRFRTRTKGGGRGFSGDCLILDEAMFLAENAHGALLPTLSARPMSQVWYAGSAVDQMVHEHGVVFARVRERGQRGEDPSLAYFEHSAGAVDEDGRELGPHEVSVDVIGVEESWLQANPGLGIRITAEHVANELRSLDPRTFAVERLGIGDWPATVGGAGLIDIGLWDSLADPEPGPLEPLCLAVDVSPDRSVASIGVAGRRSDGRFHVELVDRRKGTRWVTTRLVELRDEHQPASIVLDAAGPVASLLRTFEDAGLEVEAVTAREHAQACGILFDLAVQDGLRHFGQQQLRSAVQGAATRPLGDAWAWARKTSSVDISPLVAATLALYGAHGLVEQESPVMVAFG